MQQINPTASPRGQLGASQAKFHLEEHDVGSLKLGWALPGLLVATRICECVTAWSSLNQRPVSKSTLLSQHLKYSKAFYIIKYNYDHDLLQES